MKIKDLKETPNKGIGVNWDFKTFTDKPPKVKYDNIKNKKFFIKKFNDNYYYFVWDDHSTWHLILSKNDEYTLIGYLKLIKYDNLPHAMQVDGIEIHQNYRKNGLSTFLYRSIQEKTNTTIVSDYVQYENSRKIWLSLSQKNSVKIFNELTNKISDKIQIEDFDDPSIWGKNHTHELLVFESVSVIDKLLE
jgi:hypothetical protein